MGPQKTNDKINEKEYTRVLSSAKIEIGHSFLTGIIIFTSYLRGNKKRYKQNLGKSKI
jgi:hypothetical protein